MKRPPLLTTNNHKTMLNEGLGYKSFILYMSPHKQNSRGKNLCPNASKGCAEACLVGSGNARFEVVRKGRLKKSEYFLSNRIEFLNQLRTEIQNAITKYEGKAIVTIRLNGTSDIPYEKFKVFEGKNIFEVFPKTKFYDYTKNYIRFQKPLPSNYHLTFSRSETNHDKAMELLSQGTNIAIVMTKLIKSYNGYPVVNGDLHDLINLHPKGSIVSLRYKQLTGKGVDNSKAVKSGFVLNTDAEYAIELYNEAIKRIKQNVYQMELV